mmetsp:Transcript_28571/g.69458  ORF Transcript_28571/g.69458 Transcript_28571/m.69458 type:complete len:282 (-) Transcript_28571:67-912(-)
MSTITSSPMRQLQDRKIVDDCNGRKPSSSQGRILSFSLSVSLLLMVLSSLATTSDGFVLNNGSSNSYRDITQNRHCGHVDYKIRPNIPPVYQPSHLPRTVQGSRRTATATATALAAGRWDTDEIEGNVMKLKNCFPYILPLVDGDHYGRFIYQHIPPLGFLHSLFIGPLAETFDRVPFASLGFFLALTIGTRANFEMDRTLRFNAQQAALIDVSLVFPELVGSIFDGVDMPRTIVEPCCNFVYYTYMSACLYSLYSIVVLKRKPDKLPWISGFSENMTGPF